jgi:hypothetical protein
MTRILLLVLLCWAIAPLKAQNILWQDVPEQQLMARNITKTRWIVPQKYRTLQLDVPALRARLRQAPMENLSQGQRADNSSLLIDIPLPDGRSQRFQVVESPIMEPALAAKFPQIKTYLGQAADGSGSTVRFSLTHRGFHAMMLSPTEGATFIDPYYRGDERFYVSYFKKDYNPAGKTLGRCEGVVDTDPEEGKRLLQEYEAGLNSGALERNPSGATLRTYRIAIAATGEYTTFHSNPAPANVDSGMVAIVVSLNRVNEVYENELAVRMILVANNDLLIYTNPATDPYTNNNGSAMLSENQTTLDGIIGGDNYDIGHVFSTGGGGVAFLRSVCSPTLKAGGVTGQNAPIGDPFDIDYVCHEIGHQFGGNHTQNGNGPNTCNRVPTAAFEPGSASTIMGYAGICLPNVQNNSDPYFHTHSLQEMFAFISGTTHTCDAESASGNTPPVIVSPANGTTWNIPANTPFRLTGLATDANGDALTYCWEQYDLTSANGEPLFRSRNPTSSGTRHFPALDRIAANQFGFPETLPSTARAMNFRLTVRDNRVGAGAWRGIQVTVNTVNAGSFAVSYPNTAVSVVAGTSIPVIWSVGTSNAAPVNCQKVNIRLSTDGGNSYPMVLASNIDNTGQAVVTLPAGTSTQARIMVEANDNIFFDVSNVNFTITASASGPPLVSSFLPLDNATRVDSLLTELRIFFNQNISKNTGVINLRQYDNNALIQAIDVSTAAVTTSGNQAVINTTAAWEVGERYYVEIPATAFRNGALQNYAGTVDKNTWDFTIDGFKPLLALSFSPENNATNVTAVRPTITFNRPVAKGTVGAFTIFRSSDNISVVEIPISSNLININNAVVEVTLPTGLLRPSTQYYVIIPATAFRDGTNTFFAGISNVNTWTFTTGATVTSLQEPSQGSLQIYPNPSTGTFRISLKNNLSAISTVQVYNVLGEKVLSLQGQGQDLLLDMAKYQAGVYIVEMQIGQERIVRRLLKQ